LFGTHRSKKNKLNGKDEEKTRAFPFHKKGKLCFRATQKRIPRCTVKNESGEEAGTYLSKNTVQKTPTVPSNILPPSGSL